MTEQWLITVVWIIAGLSGAAFAMTWIPAMVIKRRHLSELRARCKNRLALTYDDGPGPLLTERLLDLLQRHGAKATFFLVGFRALRAPQLCDRLMAAGHELGCHTHMHKKPWRVWPWQTAIDANDGYRSMAKWLAPNAPFRPPFGKLTTWSWIAARRRKAPLSCWTFDGADTHATLPDPSEVANAVVQSGGGVVLLHSHDRGQDRQRYVLNLTEQLLTQAREHRLDVCTVSQLLDRKFEHVHGAAHANA